MTDFAPKVVAFLCHWCSYGAADAAGSSRKIHPANVKIVRVMCSGRVDPQLVLEAFAAGADGVMILGCHPGDCHYHGGNHQTLRRYHLLRRLLAPFGIDPGRLVLGWIAASEGDEFVALTTRTVESLARLGPLACRPRGRLRPDGPQ